MSFLSENLAAVAVAAVASLITWLFGGMIGDLLIPVVPWLFVVLMEVLAFFPQKHHQETIVEARSRVWRNMKRDPLVWIAFGFLFLLLIPFVNNGLCPNCDAVKIAHGFKPDPPIPFVPFCVNRLDHLNVVFWFAIALPSMVVVRHSLLRRGKRMVLQLIVWNGVALAALGFLQNALGAPGPLWDENNGTYWNFTVDFFSTFGYANTAGDYFTTLFGIAVALWRDHYERFRAEFKEKDISKSAPPRPRMFWKKHFYLIPAGIFFFAAVNTLSRAAMVFATVAAFVFFVHTMTVFLMRMPRIKRVTIGMWSLIIFAVVVYFSVQCMPKSMHKEIDSLNSFVMLDRVTGKGQYHQRVAIDIWLDHKLFGVGGWGYVHFCLPTMPPEERKAVQLVGGMNVHNDYLQFLAEHGLVGFGALVAIVIFLIMPIASGWRRMARDIRFCKGKELPPKPRQLFVLPAAVLFILITALSTFIHAFGDCPFRSPAVLTLFFVSLAAMPGFMPRTEITR